MLLKRLQQIVGRVAWSPAALARLPIVLFLECDGLTDFDEVVVIWRKCSDLAARVTSSLFALDPAVRFGAQCTHKRIIASLNNFLDALLGAFQRLYLFLFLRLLVHPHKILLLLLLITHLLHRLLHLLLFLLLCRLAKIELLLWVEWSNRCHTVEISLHSGSLEARSLLLELHGLDVWHFAICILASFLLLLHLLRMLRELIVDLREQLSCIFYR